MNTISFPHMFNKNRYTLSTSLSYDYQSTNESLKSLLLTNPGELLGDPTYGCGLLNCLFVNVIKIYAIDNNNKYKITIKYTLKPNGDNITFELIV